MCKYEKLFLGIVLGAIFPLIGFLAGWWSTSQLASNAWVFIAALVGLIIGIIVDALILKKWVSKAFEMDLRLWMGILFFYAICVFGFFMGVPVFNLALAIPAGLVIGRKFAHQKSPAVAENRTILRTNLFTTGVLAFICASSAFLALRDPTTAANLEGMLRLNFEVTQGMIVALIVVGGAGLLAVHWWLVIKTIHFARGSKAAIIESQTTN
ncbi:MAG: hypothetical protein CVU43_08055 [Chloroflexi bacterium HGW-Chloroflexi-5]|jgi:hypothetical protein|nr:MAG: hypothetical protein CVU43_08055 [Chloroflexi bacterium HGW-Chloroflexi-5]